MSSDASAPTQYSLSRARTLPVWRVGTPGKMTRSDLPAAIHPWTPFE
jgi:hypothetical protein